MGCSDKNKDTKETFNTVVYYDDNPKVRAVRIKECNTMTKATQAIVQDCHNANTSFSKTQSPIYPPKNK